MSESKIATLTGISPLTNQRALPDDVYDALLDMLTWGTLEPDSALAIDRMARSLDVSPTPVREALARLEHTGLVTRTARRGYRVAPPLTAEQMAELADARLVLEIGALERAMNPGTGLVEDLSKALDRHIRSTDQLLSADPESTHDALKNYFIQDWEFHQVILDHCGNRYITRCVDGLHFSVHRMRQTVGIGSTDAPIAVTEHRAVLDAVKTGDKDVACNALTNHLTNVGRRSSES